MPFSDEQNEQIVYKEYVNLGIAVDTPRGLVVPNIRNADRLTICNCPGLGSIAERARAHSLGSTTFAAARSRSAISARWVERIARRSSTFRKWPFCSSAGAMAARGPR